MRIKLIYFFLLLISCGSTQNLLKNQVIEIAENYVIEQGYSDKKIDFNTINIDYDILDQYNTPEKIASLRYNTLNSKAVYSKKVENGWIIGFEYKNEKYNEVQNGIRFGKGLWISENGKEIRMFHENIGFN